MSLKLAQLKHWAFLTGQPNAMTRSQLIDLLLANLPKQGAKMERSKKVLSVDMGIRNLAFCTVERGGKDGVLKVANWRKMDLMRRLVQVDGTGKESEIDGIDSVKEEDAEKDIKKADLFVPSNLSRVAFPVCQEFLALEPDQILIERQRFRSGGATMVQEWTLRVNMLESMLWAVLETLRNQSGSAGGFPTTHAVPPARVANFWTGVGEVDLRPPSDFLLQTTSRGKLEPSWSARQKDSKTETVVNVKKAKVEVVKNWVAGRGNVKLEFVGEADETAEVFRENARKPGRRPKEKNEAVLGKLDDLADCLLQGVAWLRWEENWWEIAKLWEESKELYGYGPTAKANKREEG